MANWGPVSGGLGPGTFTGQGFTAALFDSGTFVPGQLLRVGGTITLTFAGGKADASWDVRASAFASNGDLIDNQVLLVSGHFTQLSAPFNYAVPLGAVRVTLSHGVSVYQGQSTTYSASGTTDNQGFCANGTELKTGGQGAIILTSAIIDTALSLAGLPWLAVIMAPIEGLALNASVVCTQLPPQPPPITPDIASWSPDKLLQLFLSVTWNNFCECRPGTPTPVPPPVPALQQPTNWPTAPVFTCSNTDICSTIVRIEAAVNALSATVANTYQLATLQQRYRLPFAYVLGAVHSNLQNDGSFAISRLVGLRVEITTRPPDTVSLKGNPPYLIDMGWLAIEDANGMWDEKRLTRDDQLWFPAGMPTALTFQWSLFGGVTIRVTELQAET